MPEGSSEEVINDLPFQEPRTRCRALSFTCEYLLFCFDVIINQFRFMKKILLILGIIIAIIVVIIWIFYGYKIKAYYISKTAPSCQDVCQRNNFSQGFCYHTKNWLSPEENKKEVESLYDTCPTGLGNLSDCMNVGSGAIGAGENTCCCKK